MGNAAELTLELRVGARLAAIVAAFDLLHEALQAHGHHFSEAEAAILEAAAAELADAIEKVDP